MKVGCCTVLRRTVTATAGSGCAVTCSSTSVLTSTVQSQTPATRSGCLYSPRAKHSWRSMATGRSCFQWHSVAKKAGSISSALSRSSSACSGSRRCVHAVTPICRRDCTRCDCRLKNGRAAIHSWRGRRFYLNCPGQQELLLSRQPRSTTIFYQTDNLRQCLQPGPQSPL